MITAFFGGGEVYVVVSRDCMGSGKVSATAAYLPIVFVIHYAWPWHQRNTKLLEPPGTKLTIGQLSAHAIHLAPPNYLFRLYLPSCWKLSTGTWNASVSQQYLDFWLAKMWKKWLCFVMCVICSPRQLVGGDPDSCKGYPVYSRLISTLVTPVPRAWRYWWRSGNLDSVAVRLALIIRE